MATVPASVTAALSAVSDAVSTALDTSYAAGKADQSLTDAAALAAAQTTIDNLNTQVTELEAELAAQDPPPPPPPTGPAMGMDLEPGAQAHEDQAADGRIYVATGQTDIHNEKQFVRGYAAGIRDFTFSSKDTTVPKWFGTVPADVTWRYINHHEPEDDIAANAADKTKGYTLAQWHGWQSLILPAARAAGASPWLCLMSYTLDTAVSKRNPKDYVLAAGLVDGLALDVYPDKEGKQTQAQIVARIVAAKAIFGVQRVGVGEYGVPQGSSVFTAATVTEFKKLITDAGFEFADYWSNQKDAAHPNYRFTDAVAAAWFS